MVILRLPSKSQHSGHASCWGPARELTLLGLANNLAAAGCTLAGPVRKPGDAAVDGGQALLAGRALRPAALRSAGAVLALCTAHTSWP